MDQSMAFFSPDGKLTKNSAQIGRRIAMDDSF